MSLLTTIQDVCPVIGVAVPQSVFANIPANRTMQEMLALANEMARRISYDNRDWTLFKTTQVYAGDGVKTSFPMPADYKRMLLNSNVWRSTSTAYPMRFIPDYDSWLQRRMMNINDARGEWTMVGGQMLIWPALSNGATATYTYLKKNCINLTSGGAGSTFLADTDTFALDERLLTLGMIWQWKANKGSPYNEDMATFSDAMAKAMGADSPSPIVIGRMPLSYATKDAYPFPLPDPGP